MVALSGDRVGWYVTTSGVRTDWKACDSCFHTSNPANLCLRDCITMHLELSYHLKIVNYWYNVLIFHYFGVYLYDRCAHSFTS